MRREKRRNARKNCRNGQREKRKRFVVSLQAPVDFLHHIVLQRRADIELGTLRSTVASLRENVAELEDERSSLSRSHSQLSASHKAQSSVLARQNDVLEQEVTELRALAKERGVLIQDLQQQLDVAHAATDSSMRSTRENENWSVVRDELQRQAEYLRSLESMNAKLTTELTRYKDRHANAEVLREEKRALESKVVVMEGLREKVARLEAQVEAAKREREDWQVLANLPLESSCYVF